jgi:hypothetical protein
LEEECGAEDESLASLAIFPSGLDEGGGGLAGNCCDVRLPSVLSCAELRLLSSFGEEGVTTSIAGTALGSAGAVSGAGGVAVLVSVSECAPRVLEEGGGGRVGRSPMAPVRQADDVDGSVQGVVAERGWSRCRTHHNAQSNQWYASMT